MNKPNNSKIYRAAIYLRLSKEDDSLGDGSFKSESNSITNQRMLILGFLDSVSDISPIMEFVDDGYSGSNFDRPDFQKMIEIVKAGKVNCVIVKDFSRFGRDFIGSGLFMSKMFPELGIRFISINDHYDSLTADMCETALTMPVKNLINDSYSRDISVKVRTNQRIKRINGEYKKSIGINCSAGFKKNAKAKWYAASVFRVLTDEVYIGNLLQSKTEKVNYKVKKTISKPSQEWVRCDDNHESIISKVDFEAVQLLLRRDTKSVNKENAPYIFSGMLFCGDGGKSMVRRLNRYKDKEIPYYVCSSYNRSKSCSRHSIKEELLEEIVLDMLEIHIKKMVDTQELATRIKDITVDYDQVLFQDSEIEKMKEEQKKLLVMKNALSTDLRDGIINEEQYQKYSKVYDDKLQKLDKSVHSQEQLTKDIYENVAQAEDRLKRFKNFLNIDILERMALVTFVDRILIFEDKTIQIVFKYQNEFDKAKVIVDSLDLEVV